MIFFGEESAASAEDDSDDKFFGVGLAIPVLQLFSKK